MGTTSIAARARRRAKALTDLLWHLGAFVILNGFFWLLDGITDERYTWAYWITIFWGLALAFHVLAWFIDGRQVEDRAAESYLAEQAGVDRSAHGDDRTRV